MSKDEEEWTVVTSQDKRRVIRSGRKHSSVAAPTKTPTLLTDWNAASTIETAKEAILRNMADCQSALVQTSFYQSLLSALESIPCASREEASSLSVEHIVCLGIGNLSTSPQSPSMWQLACALAIAHDQEKRHNLQKKVVVSFYDPCSTAAEALVLREWKVRVLSSNTSGRHPIDNGKTTLFFMPHCPMNLYANVLWTTWSDLDRVIVFGNSLPLYKERAMQKERVPQTLSVLLPFVKETQVHVSRSDIESVDGNLERAFNDCYLTVFDVDSTTVLPPRPDKVPDDNNDVVLI